MEEARKEQLMRCAIVSCGYLILKVSHRLVRSKDAGMRAFSLHSSSTGKRGQCSQMMGPIDQEDVFDESFSLL